MKKFYIEYYYHFKDTRDITTVSPTLKWTLRFFWYYLESSV